MEKKDSFNISFPLYFACFAASLFSFFNILLFSSMNVLGNYFLHDHIVNPVQLGFLSSWHLWGNVLGFIPVGVLIDIYGVRRVGLSLLGLAIFATFMMGQTQNISLLCFMRFLQGLASAGSLLITMRLGSSLFPRQANITIGLMILFALSGGIAGNSFFAWLCSITSWRHAMMIVAMLGTGCWLILWAGLRIKKTSNSLINVKQIFQLIHKDNILSGIHIGLLNSPVFILGSLFGNHWLLAKTSMNLATAAKSSSLLFLGIMVGSPIWGFLADKFKAKKILITGYMALFGLSMLFVYNLSSTIFMLDIIFFSMGFFCCIQNIIYPLVNLSNPENLGSTATGIVSIVSNGLGGLLQILFGLLTQLYF